MEVEIADESAFNDFLTSSDHLLRNYATRGPWIKMFRSLMREDYACVMAHADLDPRNIIIQLPANENDSTQDLTAQHLKVVAIVDWDKSGWYPK